MNARKSVSILGCGWLGFPLAKQFLAQGYEVKGSTTSVEKLNLLQNQGIRPALIRLTEMAFPPDFLESEILVVAVPPGRTEQSRTDYLNFFQNFSQLELPSRLQYVLFVSSTSVYGDQGMEVDEETPPQSAEANGQLLAAVEQSLSGLPIPVCLLRCGGLIGPSRHPGRFFAGKTAIPNGMAPVNLIHLDDVLSIINYLIQSKVSGPVNAVAPSHPSRSEFYTLSSQSAGLESPQFVDELLNWKRVLPLRLQSLDYRFKHPDLLKLVSEIAF